MTTPASPPRPVDFWFDFVSGYSWLAIARAAAFASEHNVSWRLRPFVLGAVLQQRGRRAIAQEPSTRSYAIFDVARNAHALGLVMRGPTVHPFLSLKALRAHALHQDAPESLALARELFAACYERDEDLADTEVVTRCVSAVGLSTEGLDARLRDAATKTKLRENTDEAVALGVFGAPFFFFDGEPFWGHDRMPLLAARLDGAPGLPPAQAEALLRLPPPN
ncbi:MAG: 2-hydroxychromene-2-carboxylate isomerase [Planctomycetota bacterium]